MALAIGTMRDVARLMGNFSGKRGRFDAREAFAERARKVNPRRWAFTATAPFTSLINRRLQTFASPRQNRYSARLMSSDRIKNAMDRIDRALARIETQAALASHSTAATDADDAELAERYETLRKRVSGSISQLDDLIEGLKR